MKFLADLHIHSRYSRATSGQCDLRGLAAWAQRKGVRVVGTGDFTHPAWFKELEANLEASEDGICRLKAELRAEVEGEVPDLCRDEVGFMLTGEISSIYKRDGAVRKVHSLVAVPSLEAAAKVNARLSLIGNVKSDGRPILGLDPRNLLEILLEADERATLIPAHIWTPWFSMLGSKSGFDSPLECFGELSPHIFAVETGLSSDPPMNWRVPALDGLALVSNSDLHSPANMARNANIFHGAPGYSRMMDGLRRRDPAICGGTLDLFPEEGKYHLDGHRACGVAMEPAESRARGCVCPVCGKELTLGVLHRVEALADPARPAADSATPPPAGALPHRAFIPLPELIAELLGVSSASKRAAQIHAHLLEKLGPEMRILLDLPPADVAAAARDTLPHLDEALRRMRAGAVRRRGGYDGVYGEVRVFAPGELDRLKGAAELFRFDPGTPASPSAAPQKRGELPAPRAAKNEKKEAEKNKPGETEAGRSRHVKSPAASDLDPEQRAAVEAPPAESQIITAGPGSGKTRVLVRRVAELALRHRIDPATILAATFTCRAAAEMRARLATLLDANANAGAAIATLHSAALNILRQYHAAAGLGESFRVVDGATPQDSADSAAIGLDNLAARAAALLERHAEIALPWRHVCVDEAQDLSPDQWRLLESFRARGCAMFVVGDPDQSIYGFRGVRADAFERFAASMPSARRLALARNYRSDAAIVDAASALIAGARGALSVAVRATLPRHRKLRHYEAADARDEARFIARDIRAHLGGIKMETAAADRGLGASFRDIAVLVRTKHQAAQLETALTEAGLPVQSVADNGGILARPGGEELLKSFIQNAPARIAQTPALPALVAEFARRHAATLGHEARALLPELHEAAACFDGDSLAGFIDFLTAWQSTDRYDTAAERIALMTLHASKGLEFGIVYMAGCEEGFHPMLRADSAPEDLAEERRLFYVGMTRARQELILTHTRERTIYGKREKRAPSRFLDALPKALLEKQISKRQPPPRQMELF